MEDGLSRNISKPRSRATASAKKTYAPEATHGPSILTETKKVSVRTPYYQRCKSWLGTNWAAIVSTCALFVSALALKASIDSGTATRLHNRLSVRPHIGLSYILNEERGAGFVLTSNGAGPAIVNAFEVTVDGKPVQTWDAALSALGIVLEKKFGFSIPTPGTHLLPRTDPYVLLWVNPTDAAALHKNFARIQLKLTYCSFYDECWEQASSTTHLEPIPIPKQKPALIFGASQGWVDRSPSAQ
jgi:hypothetical protein